MVMYRIIAAAIISSAIFGCNTVDYTGTVSKIKDQPIELNNAYRRTQVNTPEAKPGTIWKGQSFATHLMTDQRACQVGDVITVKVTESTQATEKATTDLGRTADVDAGIPNFFGLENKLYPTTVNAQHVVKANTKNDFSGTGETTRKGALTAVMSARVVEVLHNGNLVIEGGREVTLNGEKKEMLVQGVVRQKDISADNSIYSTQIADAKIVLVGVGVISEKQHPGWFARLMDVFWPF